MSEASHSSAGSLQAFLAELLDEQQRLQTPVARMAALHESGVRPARPTLIPLTAPRPGEQYAFEVDLDACSGCKSCVSACHALNGLDETETWRDTGLMIGGAGVSPHVQTITSACHHCADPGCLNGCPVLAYEKDAATGIVRHLDDQCIGCQYCVLKCPYDVPKYNARLGIVRKCDLCHQRLAVGEAPACAQACPTQAIRIVTVRPEETAVATAAAPNVIPFPGPDPTYTRPTTRYVTARDLPRDLRAADAAALRVQPAHLPLVAMLTLLAWAIALQAGLLTPLAVRAPEWFRFLPVALGALGLGAATLHLGQPLRAWRVFLGLRKSWFSREAVLFGAWFGLTALAAIFPAWPVLHVGAAFVGGAGLACSVMIYVDTRRRFWRAGFTAPRFVLGGLGLALAPLAPALAVGVFAAKAAVEAASLAGESISARLQRGPLLRVLWARVALGAGGLALLAVNPWLALGPLVAGELLERVLFFRAVDAPKMPGYAAP